jgi:hypothetical protein
VRGDVPFHHRDGTGFDGPSPHALLQPLPHGPHLLARRFVTALLAVTDQRQLLDSTLADRNGALRLPMAQLNA